MSEKIIRPDFGKKDDLEKEPDLKIGDWVNLSGNFLDKFDTASGVFGPFKINNFTLDNFSKLNEVQRGVYERDFIKAYGLRWKITFIDYVENYAIITTRIDGALYGKSLEMLADLSILNKAKNQKD